MNKLSNTEAGLKKSLLYKKKCVGITEKRTTVLKNASKSMRLKGYPDSKSKYVYSVE